MKKFFKYLFSFLLTIPMVFVLTACGGDSDSGSGGNSGGGSGGSTVNTVATMYDMKVASLTLAGATSENHNTLIMLPDGKIMAIDLFLTDFDSVCDFTYEYERMIGYQFQKYTEDYLYRIDYLIDTGKTWSLPDDFFRYFKVKNFYRVNKKEYVDMWARDYLNLGYEDKAKEDFVERIKSLPSKYWTGIQKPYYESQNFITNATDQQKKSPDYMWLSYGGYDKWFKLIADLHDQGANIIATTSNSDIVNTFMHNGVTYSYTIDFFCPTPVFPSLSMKESLSFIPNTLNSSYGTWGYTGEGVMYVDDEYDSQAAEFRTIVSIKYGDFDLLYLNAPTYNVFDSFLKNHNPNKKYDVLVGTFYQESTGQQYRYCWKKIIEDYENNNIYIPEYLMDISKIDKNIMIMRESYDSEFWNRNLDIYKKFFKYGDASKMPLSVENSYYSANYEGGNLYLPVITINKSGDFFAKVITTDEPCVDDNYKLLYPSIDGVLIEVPGSLY